MDVDADGAVDLATSSELSGTVGVARNRGDGSVEPMQHFGAGGFAIRLIAVDLDQDGAPDLACANGQSHQVGVLLNRSRGR